jgi:hypothetical protein
MGRAQQDESRVEVHVLNSPGTEVRRLDDHDPAHHGIVNVAAKRDDPRVVELNRRARADL